MNDLPRKGAKEARAQLPNLLDTAEQGQATLITRHGRPVAVVAPVGALQGTPPSAARTPPPAETFA